MKSRMADMENVVWVQQRKLANQDVGIAELRASIQELTARLPTGGYSMCRHKHFQGIFAITCFVSELNGHKFTHIQTIYIYMYNVSKRRFNVSIPCNVIIK
jgi:hypothetical protein